MVTIALFLTVRWMYLLGIMLYADWAAGFTRLVLVAWSGKSRLAAGSLAYG